MSTAADGLRVEVRVRPGSSRTDVGGRYGADALIVAVAARAADGAANRAVTGAVAAAFGVRAGDVVIVRGARNRSKTLFVTGDGRVLERRLAQLLGPSQDSARRGE